ncbi:MAG: hypothetical protein HGB28_05965 [Oscillochloris sp.]|nr:hypothetical protein [Oscillochloris sp.]
MTTALPPPQIVINQRPGQIQPYVETLQSYGRANAEALERAALERKKLQNEQRIVSIVGMLVCVLGLFLGGGIHPILFLILAVGIGMLIWAAQGPGKRLRAIEECPPPDVTGRCALAAWLLTNLQGDMPTHRRLTGQIELSGIEQGGTLGRTKPGFGNTTVSYTYQRWLDLELRLVDGNELRLRATERLKLRPGHYRKGSVSGKSKWKPAKRSMLQRVSLRLQMNPAVYDTALSRPPPASRRIGGLNVRWTDQHDHELRVVAEAEMDRLPPEEILQLLREIYAGLARRG